MELGFSPHGPLAGSLPSCRIKCNGARIQVGSRDFTSATEALQAYLDQYSGLTSRMSVPYKRDVSDLLDPKSILHMTADRSLQTGVRDTEIEMKLADVKTSMNSNYDRMEKSSKLRREAEDALNRSGDLLIQIQHDELRKPQSDIDSVSTDMLMTMNPTAGYSERKHIYSYKRPKSQQRTVGIIDPLTNRSDNANDFFLKRPPSSFNTRAGSIPLRERSRSVSPSSTRQSEKLFKKPQKWIKDPNVTDTKSPSWIDALDITDPADSMWSKRDLRSGRPPPSWVNGLEGSDITSLVSQPVYGVGVSELLGNDSFRDTSAQGLRYDDLMKSPRKSRRGKDKYDLTSQLPKEVMESGKKLNSSDILEQYLDNASDKKSDSILDSLKGDNRVPRCSSLDTEALIAGMSAPEHHEIAGASPITGTPSRSRRPRSPDTDIVLEGDRPWEKQVAFKSPVYVDEDTSDSDIKAPTYTGRHQPGSLETLKNMLYKLQSEESSGSREKLLAAQEQLNLSNEELEDALRDYNFDDEPGGKSLEKALSHLTKLKTLVKDGKTMRSRSQSPHVRLQSRSPSPHHRLSSVSPSRVPLT